MKKTNDHEDWLDKLYNLPENPQKPQSVDEKWIDELFDQLVEVQYLALFQVISQKLIKNQNLFYFWDIIYKHQ